MPAFPSNPTHRFPRLLEFALFLTSLLWVFAAQALGGSAARGLATRFNLSEEYLLLSSTFFLFLLALGFGVLQAISGRSRKLREVLSLPKRATARDEWALGAAIGWGVMVLAVLPIAIFGALRIHLATDIHTVLLTFVSLATLLIAALAEEVAFRGFPFRRLIAATGPVTATILLSILFGLVHMLNPDATLVSTLITILAGLLLSIAWFRTHALWLGWGLHFAWNASMGVLFGLPVSGITAFSTVIETRAVGRRWITGGAYGPEAAFFTILVIAFAIIALTLLTRDYAWSYTHAPIVPGGYPLDVAPPAAHAAMEQEALARPPALVQILPTTPGTMSVQSVQSVQSIQPIETEQPAAEIYTPPS